MKNFFKKALGLTKENKLSGIFVSATKPSMTVTFGDNAWRMVLSKGKRGMSHIKAYANNNLVFEGTYGDLVKKIKGWN